VKSTIVLFLLIGTAIGQDIVLPPPGPIPKTAQQAPPSRDYSAICSLPSTEAACKSYNELVTSRDKDLLDVLKMRDTYVCFRENEDVFSVISLATPQPSEFKKVPKGAFYDAGPSSWVIHLRFKNGQDDKSDFLIGKWTKLEPGSSPFFQTLPKANPSLSASESAITLLDEFENLKGGKTTYTLQVRRSTMRASEEFQWDDPPKDTKSTPERGSQTYDAHCIIFK
jgi:hypothetical protein